MSNLQLLQLAGAGVQAQAFSAEDLARIESLSLADLQALCGRKFQASMDTVREFIIP